MCPAPAGEILRGAAVRRAEIHSADLDEVRRAGRRSSPVPATRPDQLRPRVLYHDIVTDITDQHAVILNRNRQASMILPGQSLVYEMTPALFAAVAANEAERVALDLPWSMQISGRPGGSTSAAAPPT